MSDLRVDSTKDSLEDFKKSVIWHDIVRELSSWKRGFQKELENIVDDVASSNPSTASVLMHIGEINGRLKAVDYMLQLPNVFISIKEETSNE